MTKIQHILLGATALMVAACSGEEPAAPVQGESSVTVTLQAPGAFTRSAGDASQVNLLQYAVYGGSGSEGTPLISDELEDVSFPLALNLQLLNGREYTIVFWASSKEAPYTIDWKEASMTVNYDKTYANTETLDAFYGSTTLTVNGNASIPVTLKRPFAMVCVGTSSEPAADSESSIESSITVGSAASVLNLLTGNVSEDLTDVVFQAAPVPSGETYPVSDYFYAGYAFVLPYAATTTVSYTLGDATVEVNGVALKANYRTNIYGSMPENQ